MSDAETQKQDERLTPSLIEQWLARKAKENRSFATYSEANRDDWFATMPPEISAEAARDAQMFQYAADCLATQGIKIAQAAHREKGLREALEELDQELAEMHAKKLAENQARPHQFTAGWIDALGHVLGILRLKPALSVKERGNG